MPALAGVTAWMGLCLLDWSAWRRLPKMSRVDAAAFLVTAIAVLAVNAVLAVAIGCSLYVLRALIARATPMRERPECVPERASS
jgi:SulP family sulfate permease